MDSSYYYLIAGVIFFLPIPVVAYRLFALLRSNYSVDREGIGIQWGLREEVIPMAKIEWVRLASDLAFELPLPPIIVQGAVLGARFQRDLGHIEYIASDASNLLLIATPNRVYAISPKDLSGFQIAFSTKRRTWIHCSNTRKIFQWKFSFHCPFER